MSSKHQHKRRAIYLFCTSMSPISKKKRRQWNETEQVREQLSSLFLFYANRMGETRVQSGCQRKEHFTAGSRARTLPWNQNSSFFYIESQVTNCSAAPEPLVFSQACWYGTQHALEWFCCSPLHLWFLFLCFSALKTQQESFSFPFSFLFFWPECIFPLMGRVSIQLRIDASIPHQIKHDIRFTFTWWCRGFWCL